MNPIATQILLVGNRFTQRCVDLRIRVQVDNDKYFTVNHLRVYQACADDFLDYMQVRCQMVRPAYI